jgi:hypothetical protein
MNFISGLLEHKCIHAASGMHPNGRMTMIPIEGCTSYHNPHLRLTLKNDVDLETIDVNGILEAVGTTIVDMEYIGCRIIRRTLSELLQLNNSNSNLEIKTINNSLAVLYNNNQLTIYQMQCGNGKYIDIPLHLDLRMLHIDKYCLEMYCPDCVENFSIVHEYVTLH